MSWTNRKKQQRQNVIGLRMSHTVAARVRQATSVAMAWINYSRYERRNSSPNVSGNCFYSTASYWSVRARSYSPSEWIKLCFPLKSNPLTYFVEAERFLRMRWTKMLKVTRRASTIFIRKCALAGEIVEHEYLVISLLSTEMLTKLHSIRGHCFFRAGFPRFVGLQLESSWEQHSTVLTNRVVVNEYRISYNDLKSTEIRKSDLFMRRISDIIEAFCPEKRASQKHNFLHAISIRCSNEFLRQTVFSMIIATKNTSLKTRTIDSNMLRQHNAKDS